ncbi:hypothetical protein M1563_01600 [Patescibacteria group bacterium]|nr:hypothetical protein [Patescibacteria group bacterium]
MNIGKNWIAEGWEEISQQGNANQQTVNIGHIDPENKADPMLTSGNPSQMLNGEAVAVHGITTRGTMTKFFETMNQMAASGWMKDYTPGKIQQLRNQFNQVQNEKYDMTSEITVVKYPDEKSAQQALENQLALPTQGFAGLQIPGADGKMTSYLDNPEVRKQMSAQQISLLQEMTEKMKGQVQTGQQKAGLKYFIGEYLGYPAALSQMDNPAYQAYSAPKPKVKVSPNTFQGGGFDPLAGKGILPKRPPTKPPPKTLQGCLAIKVDNYIISGSLLTAAEALPSAGDFCESLTQYKTYIEKEEVEGKTYTTKHVVPVASNLAAEGYANKEQVGRI